MKFGTGKQIAIVLGFVAAGFATACSSDDTTDNSTTGNATGTTGGTTGSTSSTTGSGSTSTSSGNGSTGSSTGSSAGTTGDAGGLVGMPLYTFDSSIQEFAVNSDPSSTILADGGAGMVNFDSMVGHPTPGSLKLTIPFTDYGQKFDVQAGLSAADWSCKRLHVWVMFDTVTGINGLQPHVLSKQTVDGGDVYSYASQFTPVAASSAGTWVEYTFDISNPGYMGAGYDPTKIQDVGVQIITSDPPAADSGAGTAPAKAGTTIVHVDSFSLETIAGCSADGGTSGNTGTTGSATGTSGGSDGGTSAGSDAGATTGGSDGGSSEAGTTTGGSDGGASEAGTTTGGGTNGTSAGDAGTAG